MIVDKLLVKRPFYRVKPPVMESGTILTDLNEREDITNEQNRFEGISQNDFIREYYPSGHKINSEVFYPDKIKYDEKNNRYLRERVFRVAFPFQYIISVQHLVHLCGNDLMFELSSANTTEQEKNTYTELRKGWHDENMEIALYESFKAALVTGDVALVQYVHENNYGWRVLSALNGDTLYPKYNIVTGELESLARKFSAFDEDGNEKRNYVEVWDNKYYYLYEYANEGFSKAVTKVREFFGGSRYKEIERKEHGFQKIPVAYKRFEHGACWSFVQHLIETYEIAVSHLCQNNMAYAFPIMILKGDDVEVKGDMYGAVKAITMGRDDDAGFLNRPNASESFSLQLKTLLDSIFAGSFIVKPPEVKSGDMPGVAIKLIYSPSIEIATIEAKEFDNFIDNVVETFKFGYGIQQGKVTSYQNLKTNAWIEPYIHQNTSEIINNLVQSVSSGILSVETASEKTTYNTNDELCRILKEKKEEDIFNGLKDENSQSGGAGNESEDIDSEEN